MQKPKITHLGILILFIAAIGLFGSEVEPPKIYVSHSGRDSVGAKVAFAVRDKIAASPRYEYTDNYKSCLLEISIISLPLQEENYASAISVTFYFYPYTVNYLGTHLVMIVGSKVIDSQASSILAKIDKIMTDYDAVAWGVEYAYQEMFGEKEIKK